MNYGVNKHRIGFVYLQAYFIVLYFKIRCFGFSRLEAPLNKSFFLKKVVESFCLKLLIKLKLSFVFIIFSNVSILENFKSN